MSVLEYKRLEKLLTALLKVASPDKASQLIHKYRLVLYPERKHEDIEYFKKAKRVFDKIRDMSFSIVPKRT